MWEADDSQDLWATSGNSPAASMAHGERMVGSELTAGGPSMSTALCAPSAWTITVGQGAHQAEPARVDRSGAGAVAKRSTT